MTGKEEGRHVPLRRNYIGIHYQHRCMHLRQNKYSKTLTTESRLITYLISAVSFPQNPTLELSSISYGHESEEKIMVNHNWYNRSHEINRSLVGGYTDDLYTFSRRCLVYGVRGLMRRSEVRD